MFGSPGVDGGAIPAATVPGVDAPWLCPRAPLYPTAIAGELRAASSLLTGTEFEGVGDGADPDMLLARSNWSRLGTGVAED